MMIRHPSRPARAGLSLFALLLLSACYLAAAVEGAEPHGISWRGDLGTAQAESRARDLPLWIQFTGPWCPSCRRMERGAFVEPAIVATARERFVPVKLRSDEFEPLAASLGLTSLPSSVIVTPSGEVIDKWEGFGEPEEFLAFLGATGSRAESLRRAAGGGEIVLASSCPVNLVDRRKLIPGLATIRVVRDGKEYRFADHDARQAFLAHPERYTPALRGNCPVAQVDGGRSLTGDPRLGIIYRGHLYVFADTTSREAFARNPERYTGVDLASRNSCPHCLVHQPGRSVALNSTLSHLAKSGSSGSTGRPPLGTRPVFLEAMLAPLGREIR